MRWHGDSTPREISALDHEVLDDTVEYCPLVVESLLGDAADASLTSAQASKVLGCSWSDIREELKNKTTNCISSLYESISQRIKSGASLKAREPSCPPIETSK